MSFTPSKKIVSSQGDIHENLLETVEKHLKHRFKNPIAKHNQDAFVQAHEYWHIQNKPKVILDSGCGTAESSRLLAQKYADHLVIGIDQSEKRLSHSDNELKTENCLLLRCECVDFWLMAEKEAWQFDKHFLLYPNPWPKPQHLKRRWHAHPAFSSLLKISKKIELRTNWKIYADEFKQALDIAQAYNSQIEEYNPSETITAFEKKYIQSQHTLWQVTATV